MTKEELLSIGAVSKLKDVTVKGLRYYHKIGLLEPAYVNAETGYRYYSVDQLMYLDLIKIGQQHGLSIKEIKQLFENNQLSFLRSVLEQKRQDIYQEMADLNAKLNTIDHLERFIRHSKTLNRYDDFQIVHFDTRYLIKASTKGNEIEEMKSFDGLDDTISALSLEATFQYGIVTDKHKKREVFYEITEADYPAAKSRVPIEILPQGEYVVINCKKKQEAATIDRLTAYLADKDQPFEKLYFFYFLDGTLDNEAIQIQVPIKKGLRETTLTV